MQVQKDSLDEFLASVYILSHSNSTLSTYRLSIVNKNKTGFCDFLNQRYSIDEFGLVEKIKNQELDVYRILKEFVIFLDQSKYQPKSIKTRLAAVKGYLRHLGIKIYTEDCKHSIRLPKVVARREIPLTKEILVRLLRNVPPKLQTAILVSVSTGMRIGELVQLQIKDIDFGSKPVKIRIRAETTKTREERETFLTEEASNSLKDYLKRFYNWKEDSNDLKNQIIFGRTSMSKYALKADNELKKDAFLGAENVLQKLLSTNIKKVPDLCQDNENGRKMIHFHAFRKYFRTVVGNACGRDFAEAIIGHKFYLSTYYNLSEAQKKELYLKAESYLTISDYSKIEETIQDLTERCRELESWKNKFEQYVSSNNIPIPQSEIKS